MSSRSPKAWRWQAGAGASVSCCAAAPLEPVTTKAPQEDRKRRRLKSKVLAMDMSQKNGGSRGLPSRAPLYAALGIIGKSAARARKKRKKARTMAPAHKARGCKALTPHRIMASAERKWG